MGKRKVNIYTNRRQKDINNNNNKKQTAEQKKAVIIKQLIQAMSSGCWCWYFRPYNLVEYI